MKVINYIGVLLGHVRVYEAQIAKGKEPTNGLVALRPEVLRDELEAFIKEYAPSGSGFDSGTMLDLDDPRNHEHRIVLNMDYHHMNEHGYYDGWTHHKVVVTPSFSYPGFDMRITGRNKRDIKDYIEDTAHYFLTQDMDGLCRHLPEGFSMVIGQKWCPIDAKGRHEMQAGVVTTPGDGYLAK